MTAFLAGMLAGATLVGVLTAVRNLLAAPPLPDDTIAGRPAYEIGTWVEDRSVRVFVVGKPYSLDWQVWMRTAKGTPLRIDKRSSDSREEAESLAYRHGTIPVEGRA